MYQLFYRNMHTTVTQYNTDADLKERGGKSIKQTPVKKQALYKKAQKCYEINQKFVNLDNKPKKQQKLKYINLEDEEDMVPEEENQSIYEDYINTEASEEEMNEEEEQKVEVNSILKNFW